MRPIHSILRVGAIAAAFAAYVAFSARLPLELHLDLHGAAPCAHAAPEHAPPAPESPDPHAPEHCPICVALAATAHALELDPPVQLAVRSGTAPAGAPPVVRPHSVARPSQTNPRGPPAA